MPVLMCTQQKKVKYYRPLCPTDVPEEYQTNGIVSWHNPIIAERSIPKREQWVTQSKANQVKMVEK